MAPLLNLSSTLMCPHGGTVSAICANTRAKAGGGFILRSGDTFTIAGCPLNISLAPHPCVQVQWVQASRKARAAGAAVLTSASVGLCVAADQAVQGTVLVTNTQTRVSGT
ncbi:hypothetical protein [Candidatus Cyanaurora vandensis]|uniref:hypothetical protein n=1 Tax=Candidatus Cyanaurora vandensis TaxID=2714958 RepID=UPI00257AFCC9|nr:hypothetical protein [Candidatus Cyanaurora vandensis]